MHLDCPHCGHDLEFSGARPPFCAYCGKAIAVQDRQAGSTAPDEDATLPPDPTTQKIAAPPKTLGGYRLLRRLGAGGMGAVYEAEEIASGRRVAVKISTSEHSSSSDSVERFRREGRLASTIADPRCVFILAAEEDAGQPYIVMELMPGDTLKDLLDRQGFLPIGEAIAKIMDVIDGLRAAHRLGVIHRDVKPSNCFLEANGRIKIGDFGLSKSLMHQGDLTRTGAFLGTPLFASPEQVRGETVDRQSDLYSVAATLYCMLTGRAPFQSDNAAITVARIASDSPPPMRSVRSDLPEALDEVVLRGLERDRNKRWRDLDAFKTALLPYLPGAQGVAGLGMRFGAFLIDYLILMVAGMSMVLFAVLAMGQLVQQTNVFHSMIQMAASLAMWMLFFAVPESLWGCSLGKWLVRLRVRRRGTDGRASTSRTVLRTILFYVLVNLGGIVSMPVMWDFESLPSQQQTMRTLAFALLFYPMTALGIGSILCTMRKRNGYRGLHEFLSGTWVLRLPEAEKTWQIGAGRPERMDVPGGMVKRIGAYTIRGILPWEGAGTFLLGEDPALERRVVVWLRPAAEPALSEARRQLTRPGRLRWLAGGSHEGQSWDAFMAPTGQPLPDLIAEGGRLAWSETRPILDALASELVAAGKDGTRPALLRADQVRLQSNGQVELLDWPRADAEVGVPGPEAKVERIVDLDEQEVGLLQEVAVLALQGDLRPPRKSRTTWLVRAPLPGYAAELMSGLVASPRAYRDAREFQAAMAEYAGRPTEIGPGRRAAHIAALAGLLAITILGCLSPSGWMPGTASVLFLMGETMSKEETLRQLQDGAYREAALASINPDPLLRLQGMVQLDTDLQFCNRLKQQIDEDKGELEARTGTSSLLKTYSDAVEKEFQKQRAQGKGPFAVPARWVGGARSMAYMHTNQRHARFDAANFFAAFYCAQMLFWAAVWVLWAFAFRGGFSFGWLGLSLARADGRRAARWQCAWRALLVWTPVMALWAGSLVIDIWYWSTLRQNGDEWLLWLSSGMWWAGVILLPLYALLAIQFPKRSLHDVLAGTYVVPK